MKETINKTNEQLHQELEQALETVGEKVYNLLHYGRYTIESSSRNYQDGSLVTARIAVGSHHLYINNYKYENATELQIKLKENPVTKELLDHWDDQMIDNDLMYARERYEQLLARKKELLRARHEKNHKNDIE